MQNEAIVLPTKDTDEYTLTTAKAMSAGWMWIKKWLCFETDILMLEQAKECKSIYKIEIGKNIKFEGLH